ncbi:winged helix-turn-helix transcriptional regulator [Streptomyces lydicus]|uniref:winged helix-turn-helix transcriptional regulator n=1 Tax=Streptomyces lydicus TaxID=47763 RepID=UPI0010111625|nr:helix-turn-helix domain-containing protein [Streptomyces lydicus]MCZ1005606.1 helix-turn-helix domain-containing protein [Streptomyces lydicus]
MTQSIHEPAPIQKGAEIPIKEVLCTLSARWSLEVMAELDGGKRRFNELTRRLEGINHKVLIETLHKLQRDGYVRGPLTSSKDSTDRLVGYELTELGMTLLQLVGGVREWLDEHEQKIVNARTDFDWAKREMEFMKE